LIGVDGFDWEQDRIERFVFVLVAALVGNDRRYKLSVCIRHEAGRGEDNYCLPCVPTTEFDSLSVSCNNQLKGPIAKEYIVKRRSI
jgi:hypothetical protein